MKLSLSGYVGLDDLKKFIKGEYDTIILWNEPSNEFGTKNHLLTIEIDDTVSLSKPFLCPTKGIAVKRRE